jgi:hypothetical protein
VPSFEKELLYVLRMTSEWPKPGEPGYVKPKEKRPSEEAAAVSAKNDASPANGKANAVEASHHKKKAKKEKGDGDGESDKKKEKGPKKKKDKNAPPGAKVRSARRVHAVAWSSAPTALLGTPPSPF